MDIEAWSNIFSAFGTVAAAAVAAYSARLAWRQVSLQFEPSLIVRSARFQIQTTNSLRKDFWWSKPSEEARYKNGGSEDYVLSILNMGHGPAFDLRVFTEIDYIGIHEDISNKLHSIVPDLDIRYDDFGCNVYLDGEVAFGFRLPDEAFGLIEMVGGVNTDDREKSCNIDPNVEFFSVCYAQYLRSAFQSDSDAREAQVIPITFRLEYLNSSGVKNVRKQKMHLSIQGGRYKNDGSDGVSIVSIY